MSSSTTSDSLSKAYRLIEADELAAARAVLEPLVESEPNNADAWWLYAHAVTDTFAARRALDEVLRINPNYPGAVALMSQLEVVSRTDAETEPVQSDLVAPVEFDEEPETILDLTEDPAFDDEPDFADEFDGDETPDIVPPPTLADEVELRESVNESSRRSWVPIAALVAIVAIVLLAALLLLNPGGQQPDNVVVVPSPSPEVLAPGIGVTEEAEASATPVEDVIAEPSPEVTPEVPVTEEVVVAPPTVEEPTEEAIVEEDGADTTETDAPATEDAVEADSASAGVTEVAMLPPGADFTPLVDALSEVSIATTDVSETETDLGTTVVVTVCATNGMTLRQNLPAVMDVVASRAAVLAGSAEAIGARVVNCATDRALVFIAVPKEQAVEYAVGNLTTEEFQALWRPQ